MEKGKYYGAALLSFTIWGFFSLVLRPLSAYGALDILFYRVFACVLMMLPLILLARRKALKADITLFNRLEKSDKRNFLLIHVGGGLLLTANWFFFIYAMNHISVRSTSLAYLICPILTVVFAYVLLRERLDRFQWIAVSLSAVGCLLLSLNHWLDMLVSLLMAVSYALYLVTQRKTQGFDKFFLLTIHITVSSLVLLPFYPNFSEAIPTEPLFYGLEFLIAAGFTILPLFLNLYALKGLSSSAVGMLININPLIAFTLSVTVWHEPFDALQLAAYGIIFFAIIIFNWQKLTGIARPNTSK